jgi:hypothetical protein
MAAGWKERDLRAELQLLGLRNTFDAATLAANAQARTVEQDLQRQIDDLGKDSRETNHRIDSDVVVAESSTDGLLHVAAGTFAAATSCDPGVARRGQAATNAAYLYSQLLEETQHVARGLAAEADRARAAGASCEVAYDLIRGRLNGLTGGPAVTGR